jgi:DNA-binding SARP family transcriptional activator
VADALLDSGDAAGAGDRYLALAALHRAAGRPDAAMDACLALLALAPSDHRLQLAMAAIQADQGWIGTATEKLRLLARLAELDEDADASAAVAAFATELGLGPATPPAAGV